MIRGVHAMFYTSQPEAARAFFRDKLGFPFTDVGEGWLIFEIEEADLGFHPAETPTGVMQSGTPLISFYCDNIEKSMAQLKEKGVEFTSPVEDHGYGLVTFFKAPGDFTVQLYQPRYVKNPQRAPAAMPAPLPEVKEAPKVIETPAPPKRAAKPAPRKPIRAIAAKPKAKSAKKPVKAVKAKAKAKRR